MTTGQHRLPSILWWNILSNPSPLPVFPLAPWQQIQFPTARTDHVIYRVPLNIQKFFIWLACDLLYPCTSLHLYSEVLCSHVLGWLITEVMPNNVIPFVMLFRIIVNLSPVQHDEGQSPWSCFVGFQAMPQSRKKMHLGFLGISPYPQPRVLRIIALPLWHIRKSINKVTDSSDNGPTSCLKCPIPSS